MKATTPEGEILDIRPGANINGRRFVSVELTIKDFNDDRLYEWLREMVDTRMVTSPAEKYTDAIRATISRAPAPRKPDRRDTGARLGYDPDGPYA